MVLVCRMVDEALEIMENSNLFEERALEVNAELNLRYTRGSALEKLEQ
jgi:hypothetical protein|eukprot:COSAG02_NODE_770_length_17362_cov_42.372125_6_plen_48_part_00